MSTPVTGALLLSPNAAAKALGICRRSLEREIARGKFPRPLKIGSSSRFRWEDITQYLERLTRERSSSHSSG